MLQIRLSRGPPGDAGGGGGVGGGAAKPSAAAETVTVACPDHLVLADLPVAKSLGAVTSSARPALRSVGRRSRRVSGDRVHFCVRCDFPIAVYGRLIPCEHAFCLTCARSDSSCYLCDERIQKIQTIKMMEGIFICAAPHCLKSFLKKTEFVSHIHETHADLLQPQNEKEGGNEGYSPNITRPPSTDIQRQSPLPETSTARAPPRPVFSTSSNSQLQEREEKNRRHPSKDQPLPKLLLQPKPPTFYSHQQNQLGDPQTENNPPQGFDRPYNLVNNSQGFENQSGTQYNRDSSQIPSDKQFSTYPPLHPLQPPNYPLAMNVNQAQIPTPISNPAFPTDGSPPYYGAPHESLQREKVPDNGSEQGSVLGFPPAPAAIAGFPDNFPRPWGMGFIGVPFEPLQVPQGIPEGFANLTESQGGAPFFQGGYGQMPQGLPLNPPTLSKESEMKAVIADQNDGKGVLAPLPLHVPLQLPLLLPPPPPLPPPLSQQFNNNSKFPGSSDVNREVHGYGWQNDNRGFGNGPD